MAYAVLLRGLRAQGFGFGEPIFYYFRGAFTAKLLGMNIVHALTFAKFPHEISFEEISQSLATFRAPAFDLRGGKFV